MRYVKICGITFLLYILQTTLFSKYKIFFVVPNFVTVMLFCHSLLETQWFKAAFFGIFCGLLLDASSGAVFGINCILCMTFAILCCLSSVRFFKGKFLVCILFSLVMSMIYESLFALFGFIIWNGGDFAWHFVYKILPVTLLNMVVAGILYAPIRKIVGLDTNNKNWM